MIDAWIATTFRPAGLVGKINFPCCTTHIFLFFHTDTHTYFRRQQFDNDSLQRKWEHKCVKKNTTKTAKQKSKEISFVSFAIKLQKQARSDHDHIIIFVQMLKVASSLTFRKQNINKIKIKKRSQANIKPKSQQFSLRWRDSSAQIPNTNI